MAGGDFINAPACVIAVDPGLSGAACKLGLGQFELRRDFKTLLDIQRSISALSSGVTSAVVEFVHSRPGEGTVSVFSFGRSTGVAFGSLFAAGFGSQFPIEEVHPVKWQNFIRSLLRVAPDVEFDSRALALQLFPEHQEFFKRKKDHGSADAALMAVYRLAQEPLVGSLPMSPRLLHDTVSSRRRSQARRSAKAPPHSALN